MLEEKSICGFDKQSQMHVDTVTAAKKIYIARGSDQRGHGYSVDKIKSYLNNGVVSLEDMAWCEGMLDWAPLSSVIPVAEGRMAPLRAPVIAQPAAEISAADVGESCFELATGFQESYTTVVQELQTATDGEVFDLGRVWVELICLGAFSVDYAIQNALKHGPVDAVLSSYHSHLQRLKINGVPDFFGLVRNRFETYSRAVNTGHPKSYRWNVAEAFSEAAGVLQNPRLIKVGGDLFDQINDYVAEWIHELGVENIGEE